MSSPLFSILANLDSSARSAEDQLDRLHAGLEVNEQLLIQSIRDACQQAASLSEVIRSEQPEAEWNDRGSLENLILELTEAAEARRIKELQERLLHLAGELEAGRIKHRFAARTAQLDALRLEAVRELRTQAANSGHPPELPGPEVSGWLVWAFNLDDDKDAAVLSELRSNFAALERFTAEMEEIYWLPDQQLRNGSPPSPPPTGAGGSHHPSAAANAAVQHGPSIKTIETAKQVDSATRIADITGAFSAAYQHPVSSVPAPVSPPRTEMSSLWQASTATATLEPAVAPTETDSGSEFVSDVTASEQTAATSNVTASTMLPAQVAVESADAQSGPIDVPSAETQPEAIVTEPQSAAIITEAQPAAIVTEPRPAAIVTEQQPAETETPSTTLLELTPSRRRPIVFWMGAIGFVVLSALFFAIIYHLHAHSSKPVPTVQAANAGPAAENSPSDSVTESAPAKTDNPKTNLPNLPGESPEKTPPQGPLLHQQPAEGAQDSILLSVENCNRGNPGDVECWGYVSNLGGASSRVSLDRIDVVDSRGNSFSLDRNGQFTFPTGQSSNIPAGSRVRYTVKVPDKDVDARTLTLYMDLSNPRSLEYTFRDVPVVR